MLINEGNLVNLVQLLKQIHCSKFQTNLSKPSLSPVWITTGIFMQEVSYLFFSPHTTFNIYIHFFNEKILIYEPIYIYTHDSMSSLLYPKWKLSKSQKSTTNISTTPSLQIQDLSLVFKELYLSIPKHSLHIKSFALGRIFS